MPTLDSAMQVKDGSSAVLALSFSNEGALLAVSFDNDPAPSSQKSFSLSKTMASLAPGEKLGQAYILIFVNRESSWNPGYKMTSEDPYVVY